MLLSLQTSQSRGVSQHANSFDNPFGPWSYDALAWAYCHDDHPANYMGYPPRRGEPADAEPNEHGDESRGVSQPADTVANDDSVGENHAATPTRLSGGSFVGVQ